MSHYTGKLAVAEDGTLGSIVGDDGSAIGQTFRVINDPLHVARKATARRLVACWNACHGLSTEVLEKAVAERLSTPQ